MAMTRRTQEFAALAADTQLCLAERGITVGEPTLDAILNHEIDKLAGNLGVEPRRALMNYRANGFSTQIADLIQEAIRGEPSRHLRVVPDDLT